VARAHNPDAVIEKVLARFKDTSEDQVGRCRATLVLEPELAPLERALTDGNFTAIVADRLTSVERRNELLAGRIVITRDAASYIDDAPVLEFGIIGLDALGSDIYIGPTLPESATAQVISKAFLDFGLGNERGAYLLLLHPERRHVFRRLS